MITRLANRDLAIVDTCDLVLASGYTVLTGETGAGKSLLVDAISLLLGDRGEATLVRSGASRALVEGTFEHLSPLARQRLVDAGVLDDAEAAAEEPLLVRREIAADGRSRAWINDRAVTLTTLRAVGEATIDLCGQHAQQSLTERGAHLAAIDAYAGLTAQRAELATVVTRRDALRRALTQEETAHTDRVARADMIAFHLTEIDRLDPRAGEIDELKHQREILRHAEKLVGGVAEIARHVIGPIPERSEL